MRIHRFYKSLFQRPRLQDLQELVSSALLRLMYREESSLTDRRTLPPLSMREVGLYTNEWTRSHKDCVTTIRRFWGLLSFSVWSSFVARCGNVAATIEAVWHAE